MALSGKSERRSLSLVDVQWAEIDAEAETDGCKWYEVIQRYIAQGRETQASQMASMAQQIGQLHGMVQALIDGRSGTSTDASPAAPPDPYAEYAPYADEIRAMEMAHTGRDAERTREAEAWHRRQQSWWVRLWGWLWTA